MEKDNGPLWSQDNAGFYWLMFPNFHALSIKEINTVFSEFGKVRRVTKSGDEKGHRFVQYSNLEDIEKAVEGLKNHPTVSLRPYRPKEKKRNIEKEKSNDNDKSDNRVECEESCSKTSNTEDGDCSRNMYQRRKPPQSENTQSNGSLYNSHLASNVPQHPVGNKLFARIKEACPISNSASSYHLNASHTINDFDDNDDEDTPELVLIENIEPCVPAVVVLKADEVVVGNIDRNFGVGYILHLFENYEPLAVTFMQTIASTGLRYCRVYFKNTEDASEVESRFDKYKLAGKSLIVMRPHKVMAEAGLSKKTY